MVSTTVASRCRQSPDGSPRLPWLVCMTEVRLLIEGQERHAYGGPVVHLPPLQRGDRGGSALMARPVMMRIAPLDQGMIPVAARSDVRDEVEDFLACELVHEPLRHDR